MAKRRKSKQNKILTRSHNSAVPVYHPPKVKIKMIDLMRNISGTRKIPYSIIIKFHWETPLISLKMTDHIMHVT